jgi:hypothetical protein
METKERKLPGQSGVSDLETLGFLKKKGIIT